MGKQRVENLQIAKALFIPTYGWQNHPAVRMWRGYELAFLDYQFFVCNEWTRNRGYKDTCLNSTLDIFAEFGSDESVVDDPWWMKNWNLHYSHQSNLIRKDPVYYQWQFPEVPNNLEYVWPV